ncbi:MAG: translation initiation factor IF-2 [Kofleriaceae bacterium]|nr:translation initiation factor IF-2 [Kofleriaceae bacterium]
MRVYEIAKEVGIPNKDLLVKIRALGLDVNNHMSSLGEDDVARIKRSLEKEKHGGPVEAAPSAKSAAATVVRRRSSKPEGAPDVTAAPVSEARPIAPAPVIRRRAVDEPTVAEAAPVHVAAVTPAPATPTVIARPRVVEPPSAPTHEVAPRRDSSPMIAATTAITATTTPAVPAAVAPVMPVAVEPLQAVSQVAAPIAATVVEKQPAMNAGSNELANGSGPVAAAPVATPPVPKPRPRNVVVGPSIVARHGAPEAQPVRPIVPPPVAYNPPASTPLPTRGPSVVVRTRDTSPVAPPVVVEPVTARGRFEEELERARARTATRDVERPVKPVDVAPAVEEVVVVEVPRDPLRPAVGTVIALPPRIKITERTPVGGRPVVAPGPMSTVRGRFAQQQKTGGPGGRPGPGGSRDFGKKKMPLGKKGKQTQLTTPAEHKRVVRIEDTITIGELSHQMGVKATEVLKKLWGMGMTGVTINAAIDLETAQLLSSEFGYEVQNVAFKEEDIFSGPSDADGELLPRAPVVTVMGHVDHGKTSLLDAIRKAKVAAGEAGGITQHVAAYKITAPGHGEIVFLDTPGHEAFTEMRARGAQATDIVVLVVAANDGVMPQTLEALAHAKDAKVTIIVAVNKADLPDAQPDRVRQQLADHGLIPEEWGGDTIYVNVSALKGDNIDKLLESISVSADVLELKASPTKSAAGVVIEARLDRNRGPMATVLVQEGTLRVGDIIVAGRTVGKVRAMLDDRGEPLKEAGPSTPVEVLGLDGVPEAGDMVNVAEDDRAAKSVVEHRRQAWRKRELGSRDKVSLEGLMERFKEIDNKELKIVLKADVQGSAEALKAALIKLSTAKVKVNVIAAAVGGITESDVNLAKAGGAIIVGFHVRPAGKSSKLAEQEDVEIRLYDIIYDALDEVKLAMAGLLAPIKREVAMGKLEVRETYAIPKVGVIAGCMVTDGKITRKAHLRIIRDAVQIYEGKVGSLRRFKDDASEVQNGYECGVMVAGWNELKVGDVIECYDVVEEAAKL